MMNGKMDADFAQFLDSMVNLDALDRITRDLDDELKDSQVVMNEIKGMIDTLPVPTKVEKEEFESDGCGLRHEDISNFLSATTPKLLMPDMDENTEYVNCEDVIAIMKSYTEDLKKNFTVSDTPIKVTSMKVESLDLDRYATNLDQLSKRLSSLKIKKRDEVNRRNPELEAKLSELCVVVNMFTKMIEAKTTLSETNKNWTPTQQTTNILDYDNLINKLLSSINEVSYLLQNKN